MVTRSFAGTLRAFVRAPVVVAFTLAVYGTFLAGRLTRLAPRGHGWRNACFRVWASTLCRILGVRRSCEGTPPTGVLLVANHLSYLDIPVLASWTDAVFVARADVAGWPFVGTLCRGIDTIFVDRGSKRDVVAVGEAIEARLASGLGVVLFPEGASSPGDAVLPFRSSLLEVAARDGLPVHWAAMRYELPDGGGTVGERVAWWGDMEFLPHAWELMKLPRIDSHVSFGGEPVSHPDRKALAGALQGNVEDALHARSRNIPLSSRAERPLSICKDPSAPPRCARGRSG
jgi:1-acyl-sn-glycerol-3-phosphate acyltransferase